MLSEGSFLKDHVTLKRIMMLKIQLSQHTDILKYIQTETSYIKLIIFHNITDFTVFIK